jgi:hypothetical protein
MAALVAAADAPLRFVEDPASHSAINHLFQLGRENPTLKVGDGGVPLSAYRTRKTLVDTGHRLSQLALERFQRLPAVSMTIDAGTIERRHFLDIMLLAPYSEDGDPYLYDSVEESNLSSDDYGISWRRPFRSSDPSITLMLPRSSVTISRRRCPRSHTGVANLVYEGTIPCSIESNFLLAFVTSFS